jgi:acyl dehydratase
MDDLRWHQPVRPGDTLTVEMTVLDKWPSDSHPERGYVDFERAVYNQDDEEVMSVVVHNMVQRRDVDS